MIRLPIVMLSLVLLGVAAPTAALHPGHDEGYAEFVYTVDKKGEIRIGGDVKAGAAVIRKGKYSFAHRIDAGSHIVTLVGLSSKGVTSGSAHEIRTRLTPSHDRVKKSVLVTREQPDGSYHVAAIQVVGEDDDHVPEGWFDA